jgi:hypothetical protein
MAVAVGLGASGALVLLGVGSSRGAGETTTGELVWVTPQMQRYSRIGPKTTISAQECGLVSLCISSSRISYPRRLFFRPQGEKITPKEEKYHAAAG